MEPKSCGIGVPGGLYKHHGRRKSEAYNDGYVKNRPFPLRSTPDMTSLINVLNEMG